LTTPHTSARRTAEEAVRRAVWRRRDLLIAASTFGLFLIMTTAVSAVVATSAAPPAEPAAAGQPPAPRSAALDWLRLEPATAATRDDAPQARQADAASTLRAAPLPTAPPLAIRIPSLEVDASVMDLGLHEDGTMQVPPHAAWATSEAGWYRHSPTPGTLGPAVVVGHVDSERHGPSVFYGLDTLAAGDRIEVERSDGLTAVFVVDRTGQYGKDELPMNEVYGDLDHAGLRLITCGGDFDRGRLEYKDNIVVYASLVSSHPTTPSTATGAR
jgi:sortase (surface protein transpeptidase)